MEKEMDATFKIVGDYFGDNDEMWLMRTKAVDKMTAISAHMGSTPATLYDAVRMFDRMVCNGFVQMNERSFSVLAVACYSLAYKYREDDVFDKRHTMASMRSWCTDAKPENYATFCEWMLNSEVHIMMCLLFEISSPTPFEYICECTDWLTNPARKLEAETFSLHCTALLHSWSSTRFDGIQVAAAAALLTCQETGASPNSDSFALLMHAVDADVISEICVTMRAASSGLFEMNLSGLTRAFPRAYSAWVKTNIQTEAITL